MQNHILKEWHDDGCWPTEEEVALMDAAYHEWKAELNQAVLDGDEEWAAELREMGK